MAFTDLNPIVFERRQIRRAVTTGMSEKQVRQRLGAPAIEYAAGNAPEHYYVHGWSYKRRPISNKVLIYQFGEPICYVWIDNTGAVEEVYVGGS